MDNKDTIHLLKECDAGSKMAVTSLDEVMENVQDEKLKVALEAAARGIKFLPVDLYHSDATVWVAKNDTEIYPPFNAIEGLGDTVAQNIVRERENQPFISIEDVQKRGKVSQTLIEKMKDMGILKDLPDSNQLSLF